MRLTPQLIVNEGPWEGPECFGPPPAAPAVQFYELLDDQRVPVLTSLRFSAICQEIRRHPVGTIFLVQRWETPGQLGEMTLGRQWLLCLGADNRIRSRPIRRHWPIDPQ